MELDEATGGRELYKPEKETEGRGATHPTNRTERQDWTQRIKSPAALGVV